MKKPGFFRRRWPFDMAIVLVPLLVLVALQYVSSRRLARVEVIAHQTTLTRYLDAVAAEVRRVYEDAAEEMLDVPGDALAAKRFDEIAHHFDGVDTSAALLLFAGSLDGCACLTHYYHPESGDMKLGADPATELVVLRVSALLRLERLQHLNRSETYVDELDTDRRVLYRFVSDAGSTVGFVGFVIDVDRLEREYLWRAVSGAADMLGEDVWENLIVRVTDDAGRVVLATHDELGQADVLTERFDVVFRDMELSARSRHTAATQVLRANAATSWALSILMSIMAIGGVLLTWRATRRERRLSRMRSRFVANVSHELRTPVASMAVFGELLRRGRVTETEKVVEYGYRIEQETARLGQLIDNVLSFARIESAQARYHREVTALQDAVLAAVAAVEPRRAQGGFNIAVSTPAARSPEVRVDAAAMTQVFVNLLDNAMKYSGSCRQIRVELRCCGREVAVDVSDTGIGISADDQARIFEEFYRAGTHDVGVAGTGLGLAIVRHVVRAHGGRVEVESRLGLGTTFTVVLPEVGMRVHGAVQVPSAADRAQIEAGA